MKNKDMRQIADFVAKKSAKQTLKSSKAANISQIKNHIKKYSSDRSEKDFTLTAGEMNAYLG